MLTLQEPGAGITCHLLGLQSIAAVLQVLNLKFETDLLLHEFVLFYLVFPSKFLVSFQFI